MLHAPNELSLEEIPLLPLRPGWARVRVQVCGICATDIEVWRGRIPVPYPIVLGHEWSGVVEAVGTEGDSRWVGKRVTGENEVSCLTCRACRTGHWRQCAAYQQIGFSAHGGGYAEYLTVPVYDLHELPASVSLSQAALLEPLAVAFGVLALAGLTIGDTLTIIGDGSIGLHCAIVAHAAGARRIVLSGGQAARLGLAQQLGVGRTIHFQQDDLPAVVSELHGRSDIVIDASGSVQALDQALGLVRAEGTIVLAGYCQQRTVPLVQDRLQVPNVRVIGAGNNPGWLPRALACVGDGALRSEQIISHRYALEDYGEALAQCESRGDGLVKSIFLCG